MNRTRILLLDDVELFRECLAHRLEGEPDFRIVGSCGSVSEALEVIARERVDIVLLELDLGAERGAAFLEQARAQGFECKILIVTGSTDDPEGARLVSGGAQGIVLKHNPAALLVQSIRAVVEGRTWIDPRYWQGLRQANSPLKKMAKPKLSDREEAVLKGILEGLANKEIAARLILSEASVKAVVQQLFEKSGARTRSQLVRIALENWRDSLIS